MNRPISLSVISLTFVSSFSFSAPAPAPAGPPPEEHFDIWLRPADGRIVTGSITEGTPGSPINEVERVFGAELGEDAQFPFSAFEPGIQALGGSLTAGMTWSFNIVSPLGQWNGNGFNVPDETMQLDFGPASATTGAGYVPGFSFTGFPDGLLHDHFDFTLLPGGVGDPDAGIYLLALQFAGVNSATSYAASDPVYLVFNLGQSEEDHDAAIEWVQGNIVPAPGTFLLLTLGILSTGRQRRVARA